jgi:hypothetical protein
MRYKDEKNTRIKEDSKKFFNWSDVKTYNGEIAVKGDKVMPNGNGSGFMNSKTIYENYEKIIDGSGIDLYNN